MDIETVLIWATLICLILYLFPFYEKFTINLPNAVGGGEVFGWTPHTCPVGKELDTGLCYDKCRDGYNGKGPVCWAKSQGIGIGTAVGLEDCPAGWINDGLTCREPISCKSIGDCFAGRGCGCRGGGVKGRLDGGGKCPGPGGSEYTDRVDGLCYKKCPKDYPFHIPGMPYLCYKGGDLSYGRGVGKIPSLIKLAGRYTFL